MKKIKKYLLFIVPVFLFMLFSASKVNAAMSFKINDGAGVFAEYVDAQFTRNRVINIKLDLDEEELEGYSALQICEYIKTTTEEGDVFSTSADKCIKDYDYPATSYDFQIPSYGDGVKYIGVDLLIKGSDNLYLNMRKPLNLDTTGPAINLNGNPSLYLLKGAKYTELGAICTDEFDNNPTLTISDNEITTNKYGTVQYVTYTATDFLGNVNQVKRKIVVEAAPPFEINSRIVVAVIIGALIIGTLVYIKVWQKKEKKKQREKLYSQKGPGVL